MLRISKLTDYALLILASMQEGKVISATSLSEQTRIPLATTNKILKQLAKSGICQSRSGKMGGFILDIQKNKLSLLRVIHSMEGKPTSLTACGGSAHCHLKTHCKINDKMNLIDEQINQVLSNKFISDIS